MWYGGLKNQVCMTVALSYYWLFILKNEQVSIIACILINRLGSHHICGCLASGTPNEGKQLTMYEKFQKSMAREKTITHRDHHGGGGANRHSNTSVGSLTLQGLTERISNMEQVLAVQGESVLVSSSLDLFTFSCLIFTFSSVFVSSLINNSSTIS